jgi:hypothetical protein
MWPSVCETIRQRTVTCMTYASHTFKVYWMLIWQTGTLLQLTHTHTHGHKHACIQYTLLCHVSRTVLCGLKYFPKHPPIITLNYLFYNYPVINRVEKFIFHFCTVCLKWLHNKESDLLLSLQMSLNMTDLNNSWYWRYTVIDAEIFFDDNLIQPLLYMKLKSKFLMCIYSVLITYKKQNYFIDDCYYISLIPSVVPIRHIQRHL